MRFPESNHPKTCALLVASSLVRTGTHPSRIEALRAAAVSLCCDTELRDWRWRGAVLELRQSAPPSTAVRLTAVENFDGWVVVARLPIPEKDLPPRDALAEAGLGLSMLWRVGKESPGEAIAPCASGNQLVWPEGAKPGGVLVQGADGPEARLMRQDDAETFLDYFLGKLGVVSEAVDEDDLERAKEFDETHGSDPPWISEPGLDPLELKSPGGNFDEVSGSRFLGPE